MLADHVHETYRRDAALYGRYLDACGAGETEYCVVPFGAACVGSPVFVARYDQTAFAGRGPATTLHLPFADGSRRLTLGLRDALRLLAFLFDDRGRIQALQAQSIEGSDKDVLRQFDVPRAQLRDHVAAWEEGEFLAPHEGEYAYYVVDTRGTIQLLARSPSLAALAWKYRADDEFDRARVSSRIAQLA